MHSLAHARFRGEWACHMPKPFLVPADGVAPPSPAYETGVLRLDHTGLHGVSDGTCTR